MSEDESDISELDYEIKQKSKTQPKERKPVIKKEVQPKERQTVIKMDVKSKERKTDIKMNVKPKTIVNVKVEKVEIMKEGMFSFF